MPSAPSSAARRVWRRALLAVGLSALAALPHLAAGPNGATHLDDELYVFGNPRVLDGLGVAGVRWALGTLANNNWHPLTWLSHMADVSRYGANPAGHHATSVLLHACAAGLLFLALARMTAATWRSALAAALFAVHPLLVQPVAWIADRKDVLAGVLFMLVLLAYERYVRRGGAARYLALCAALALGLAAKATLVTVPPLLLVLDAWPLGRLRRDGGPGVSRARVLAEKVPLLALAAATAAVAVVAQGRAGAIVGDEFIAPTERIANALVSYARYLAQAAWPAGIAVYYPYHPQAAAAVTAAGAALAALTALAIRQRGRRPWLLAGWLWYVGMLVPVIGLLQVGEQARADRYLYLPLVGVFIAVSWLLPAARGGGRFRRATLPAALAVIVALAGCSFVLARAWRDPVELYRRAIAATRGNWLIRNNLGARLLEGGEEEDLEEAEEHLREGLRLRPTAGTHANLAVLLARAGRLAEAEAELGETLRLDPGAVAPRVALAGALFGAGRAAEAEVLYREALRLDPGRSAALTGLGVVLAARGDLAGAVALQEQALRADPASAEIRNNLGIVLARTGRSEEAESQFIEASRLDPDLARPHRNLGTLLFGLGRPAEAEAEFREAITLRPDLPGSYVSLGILLASQGRASAAADAFGEAVRLQPGAAAVRARLAVALAGLGRTGEALEHSRRAVRERPDLAGARYARGVALAASGREEEAAAEFRAALLRDPGHAEARRRLRDLLAGSEGEPGWSPRRAEEQGRRERPVP